MGRKYEDLSGLIFGELTAIRIHKRGSAGKPVIWECLCSCNNITYVDSSSLKSKHTRSCGHLLSETSSKTHKKYNEYRFKDNLCYGKISENIEFVLDIEDYEKINSYKWCLDNGYASSHDSKNNYKKIRLHRIISNAKLGDIVDHINRNRLDNRKENLRFVTSQQNAQNISLSNANKTGIIGVHRSENNSWRVSIQGKQGKRYKDFNEAVLARLKMEIEIFGKEFSPQRHLFEQYGI